MEKPSLVPVALAIAFVGAAIALSLYFALRPAAPTVYSGNTAVAVPEVTESDHILGNPDAPIKIIEYSDLDCPFCRTFHATMKQIMAIYGDTGQVAWVYRHFPLVELHPNAPKLAEASECVAELGGNDAFWKFIDEVFTMDRYNDRFNMDELSVAVAVSGVPAGPFSECLGSGRHKEKVTQHFKEANDLGAEGTPHNIIIGPTGDAIQLPGSRAYATVKEIIDALLAGG